MNFLGEFGAKLYLQEGDLVLLFYCTVVYDVSTKIDLHVADVRLHEIT